MNELGARIRQWRRRRGMTQEDLAAAVGVSRSAVAQWETGRAGQLTGNLAKLAQVLDVELGLLVTQAAGVDAPVPEPRGADGDVALGDELALLRLYRRCSPEDQRLVLLTARRLAHRTPLSD